MIVIKLQGGLGNQMFQYAFAHSLSINTSIPFALDAIALEKGEGITRRHFSLDKFIIDTKLLNENEVLSFLKHTNYTKENSSLPPKEFTCSINNNSYFDGYWQNEDYFKENSGVIRKDFQLRNSLPLKAMEIKGMLEETNSIAVQIRRGDYVTNSKVNSIFHVCDIEYFQSSIGYLRTKTDNLNIFIFSDDIKWCKENIKFKEKTIYVSDFGLPDYQELVLMSYAKHNIISNSSFAWWGAWLNQNPSKIVIAPKKWYKRGGESTTITPQSWIRI